MSSESNPTATAPSSTLPSAKTDASEAKADDEAPARRRLDVHVHLVGDAVDELLAALDRADIEAAVVMASPHLDDSRRPSDPEQPFSSWREANDRVLELSAPHRGRLLPFITAEPAALEPGELERWLSAGACGVKLYMGHRAMHDRPLHDPAHRLLFETLEREQVPVLLHVNTFRFEAELDALLAAHPKLQLVCPHFCGSRTDVDRLERILAKHPSLRVDTSHGPGRPGIDGFANLESERERVRALIDAHPQRFLFGSDLVTTLDGPSPETAREWDQQVRANLGLLEDEQFEFYRADTEGEGQHGQLTWGTYTGLALPDEALAAVLHDNAARWLAPCL